MIHKKRIVLLLLAIIIIRQVYNNFVAIVKVQQNQEQQHIVRVSTSPLTGPPVPPPPISSTTSPTTSKKTNENKNSKISNTKNDSTKKKKKKKNLEEQTQRQSITKRLINDKTLPWDETMYRPWLDLQHSNNNSNSTTLLLPPAMILLTNVGWNNPDQKLGMTFSRYILRNGIIFGGGQWSIIHGSIRRLGKIFKADTCPYSATTTIIITRRWTATMKIATMIFDIMFLRILCNAPNPIIPYTVEVMPI